ncbi:Radical SAM domain protein [Alkaliphilus metalliredigens QYMF]|uniref:Radical SAM domain protein n=2 Tax=Alkaliphilus TaxID=114627 RepID=A6TU40_ALKMQ|nr:Radical SAM domain protein [Alkaliphilus metalliredigens QYMF]
MEIQEITLPVNEIIPFSNVDGRGNRTSIFVQGCNLNCVYCHNPETIKLPCEETQETNYTIKELLSIIKKYGPYIRGITVSGGEATLYSTYLTQLFGEVKKLGLTCYIDTNGLFNLEKMEALIPITDKFLFDIKGINNLEKVTRKKQVNSFDNLEYLLKLNKVEEVRTVCINEYIDLESTVKEVSMRLRKYDDVIYKLIRVHHRGLTLNQKELVQGFVPSTKEMVHLENLAKSIGVKNVMSIF